MTLPQITEDKGTSSPSQQSDKLSIFTPLTVQKLRHVEEFICGAGAAFINISVTFPLNKIMFRQMIEGVEYSKALVQIWREGYRYLYRGILPPLLQKTVTTSLMFGSYEHTYRLLSPDLPHAARVTIAGIAAGSAEALLTPFERVQTLLQDQNHHQRFQNTWHTIKELRPFGVREFYRGLVPVLCRNGPGNIMFFGLRDPVKSMFPPTDSWSRNMFYDFISGALLGAVIGTMFYPFNVIRANMQTRVGGEFTSMNKVFWEIYDDRGRKWSKLYYGVHMNYTRALISWGIINCTYELFKRMFAAMHSS